jgi:opacity protein-like surface antigen
MFKAIAVVLFFVLAVGAVALAPVVAAEEGHDHAGSGGHGHGDDPHHTGLFFGNAIIGETPSPHSEVRVKYVLEHDKGGDAHGFEAGIELAFARWISLEAEVPYAIVDGRDGAEDADGFDNIAFGIKLASFAFEEHGVLVGGGIEFELPTGDEEDGIGSDHVLVVEPFVTAGVKRGAFAAIGRVGFAVPVNEERAEEDEVDLTIVYHAALYWHTSERVTLLLEFDGESVVSGDESEDVLNVSPGVKVRPFDSDVEIGAAVSLPVLDDPGFDVKVTVAVFFHF